jgi:xanthine dehydrogenase YagS FAD-binding subunit
MPVIHPVILTRPARRVASPQIRNTGSIGGNLAQDARCWYYRYGLPCYRAGGNTCFADTPEG